MRVFSFISSVIAFVITTFYLFVDFPDTGNLNGIIYFSLMIILLLICVMGIAFNISVISGLQRKFKRSYR
jgi:ABC-type transport system involved in multi-copper enzyme maturation permease subunit